MAKQIAVIGLGRFGRSVALTLAEAGVEVLVIDRDLVLVESIVEKVSEAVAFDATSADQLRSFAVDKMDAVVIAIGEAFEATVLITATLHQMEVPIIVARAYDETQHRILSMVGAHQVINPEEEMGVRTAQGLLHRDVLDFVDLPEGFELRQHVVNEHQAGKTLSDFRRDGEDEFLVLQLTRRVPTAPESESEETAIESLQRMAIPRDDTVVEIADTLSLVGASRVLDRL